KNAEGDWSKQSTLRITYAFRDGGLEGTDTERWNGDDYRDDETVGPFQTSEGRYKGQRWELDENGYTLLIRGIHQRTAVNARALDRPDSTDDVKVLGRLRAPADVYVLRVAPKGGRDELRFYDAATFHLIRREVAVLDRLVVTTYDDYRTVGTRTLAFHSTFSDGHPENDGIYTIKEFAPGAPVNDDDLNAPNGRRALVEFPNGKDVVRLPARIDDWGAVIVRLNIKGRGLDFQLDSGSSSIVLDRDVAKELGLPVYGLWSQTTAGTYTSSKAIIPKVEVGGIAMHDVVVDALPFSWHSDEVTKVVGLLGFDFIAGGIVKIDYEHGTVDMMRYDTPIPKEAMFLDAVLDDNVPMIQAQMNGADGDHFILDTGADDVVLFSAFAKAHANVISDHSRGKLISHELNLISSEGVGGEIHTRGLLLEHMKIGPVRFDDFLTEVMSGDQPAFEGEDTDGLIGASVLSAFDLYLDYANSRVGFVVNAAAKKHRTTRGVEAGDY
ncbi:MAG: aspartyl protease family protein, partial [Candidatus Eremiobacteraeota bacterium]|nr:aspartyl protease family protein [Candidatus Eremiobacteraeota bacterium]MBV9407647.1 aspartyl protease family protein [Candidatus Eremiobacteraeota bacterium]